MINLKLYFSKDRVLLFLGIILLCFISILYVWINLGSRKYFIGLDPGAALLFPDKVILDALYSWSGFSAPGHANIVAIQSTIWNFFIQLIYYLVRFKTVWVFRVLEWFLVFVSGLSMFYLVLVVSKLLFKSVGNKLIYAGTFFAALFYMFNHYTLIFWGLPKMSFHTTYIIAPLLIAYFISNLEFSSDFKKIFILAILVSLIVTGNTASSALVFLLLFLYLIIFLIWRSSSIKKRKVFFFVIPLLFLSIFLNFYLLFPTISNYESAYSVSSLPKSSAEELLEESYYLTTSKFSTSLTTVMSLLKLEGQDNWPWYPSYQIYQEPMFKVISVFYSCWVVLGLFLMGRYKKRITLWIYIISVLFIFFALGMSGPLSSLYYWIWKNIPFFKQFFKTNYQRFVPVLALLFSLVISIALIELLYFIKKYFKKYIALTLIILTVGSFIFIGYNWAFFTNNVIKDVYLVNPLPQDYDSLKQYFQKQGKNSNVLTLPAISSGLGWGKNSLGNIYIAGEYTPLEKYLLGSPIMSSKWFIDNKVIISDLWNDLVLEDSISKILKYLDIFNIGYLLVHKDAIDSIDFGRGGGIKIYNGKLRAEKIESVLSGEPEIVQNVSNTKFLSLYKVNDIFFNNRFYIPQNIIYVQGGLSSLLNLHDVPNIDNRRAFYFFDRNTSFHNQNILKVSQKIIIPFESDKEELNKAIDLKVKARNKGDSAETKKFQDRVEYLSKKIVLDGKYQIDIPLSSDYKLYIRKDSELIRNNFQLKIARQELAYNKDAPKKPEGDLLYIGSLNLPSGSQAVLLSDDIGQVKSINVGDIVLKSDLMLPSQDETFNINYLQINPTKYILKLKDIQKPFLLAFTNSYHPQWKIFVKQSENDRNTWFQSPTYDKQHFIINGYANGWWIDKTGNYNLIIEFQPQKNTFIGILVSFITLLFSLVYLGFTMIRNSKKLIIK